MGAITTSPLGLTGLLQLRDFGQLPQDLSNVVIPTVDTSPFFLAGRREVLGTAGVAAAVGAVAFPELVVPAGELWWVEAFGISTAPGAGAAVNVASGVQYSTGAAVVACGDYLAVAANENGRTLSHAAPLLLSPGGALFGLVRSQTLAPNLFGTAVIVRLKA